MLEAGSRRPLSSLWMAVVRQSTRSTVSSVCACVLLCECVSRGRACWAIVGDFARVTRVQCVNVSVSMLLLVWVVVVVTSVALLLLFR